MPRINTVKIETNWEDMANWQAGQWAEDFAGELIGGIDEYTRQWFGLQIERFTRDGSFTWGDLRKEVLKMDEPGNPFSPKRAEMIATTEVTRAYAYGSEIAWEESGVVGGKQWDTANDEIVCPICGPLDGTIAKLGEDFEGGFFNPPAHPRCRCGTSPINLGDTETGQETFQTLGPRFEGVGNAYGRLSGNRLRVPRPTAPVTPRPRIPKPAQPVDATAELDAVLSHFTDNEVARERVRALQNIAKTHTIPENTTINKMFLSEVDTHFAPSGQHSPLGYYDGLGRKIYINPNGHKQVSTLTHEIGHYIDDVILDVTYSASEGRPAVRPSGLTKELVGAWDDKVRSTTAYQRMSDIYTNPSNYIEDMGGGISYSPDTDHLRYLLSPKERWARTYEQYIAYRTNDSVAMAELTKAIDAGFSGTGWYTKYIPWTEFDEVAETMDEIFRSVGWLNE